MPFLRTITVFCLLAVFAACVRPEYSSRVKTEDSGWFSDSKTEKPRLEEIASAEIRRMLENANRQTETTKNYTQEYFVIPYPNGDFSTETGACTDVVVRAFRAAGVDLQREVHEDMRGSFSAYPNKWGLPKPDTNIDHRRVPNLQTFFNRKGKSLPLTRDAKNFLPGDVVAWDIDGKGMTHIGIVSNIFDENAGRYLIIHNMCCGTKLEDRLLQWKIIGHYRYF